MSEGVYGKGMENQEDELIYFFSHVNNCGTN